MLTVCPSIVVDTFETPGFGELKLVLVEPEAVVLLGGATADPARLVANVAGVPFRTKPPPGVLLSELVVKSEVTRSGPPTTTDGVAAVVVNLRYGVESTLPAPAPAIPFVVPAHPAPVAFGP